MGHDDPAPNTEFERRVNTWRGWACLGFTGAAAGIVLARPRDLLFLRRTSCYSETGRAGVLLSAAFLAYLGIDSAVAILWRSKFRRSMTAVHAHHALVALGTAAYLLPSPPRGFFMYIWGEALTACRVLPPAPRYRARGVVFAGRRCLWLYLIARDLWWTRHLRTSRGLLCCVVPPLLAAALLGLDDVWWRQHAATLPPRALPHEARVAAPTRQLEGAACKPKTNMPRNDSIVL